MARREYKSMEQGGGNLPDVPFAENLVFYAPLTEGDLTDHISGTVPTQSQDSYCEWDETIGMYKLRAYSSNNGADFPSALKWSIPSMNLTQGQALTLVIDVQEIYVYGNYYAPMISVPSMSSQGGAYICNTRYINKQLLSTLHRYCVSCSAFNGSNFTLKFYQDGVLKQSGTWAQNYSYNKNTVSVCQLHTNNREYQIYAKNVRVYNRELSASEVAQL